MALRRDPSTFCMPMRRNSSATKSAAFLTSCLCSSSVLTLGNAKKIFQFAEKKTRLIIACKIHCGGSHRLIFLLERDSAWSRAGNVQSHAGEETTQYTRMIVPRRRPCRRLISGFSPGAVQDFRHFFSPKPLNSGYDVWFNCA